jgi:uncharacterized protein YlxW (UPF0749 family)
MQENIKKLEEEKQRLEAKISTLESYINDWEINKKKHQKTIEDDLRMMKCTY